MKGIFPQKDGLYALKLSNLGYIVIGATQFCTEDNNADVLITGENIEDVYTLVTYKGNGLFEEYYSGEKAILSMRSYDVNADPTKGSFSSFSDDNILIYSDEQQKKEKCEFFRKMPLTIDVSNLVSITPEIIYKINSSNIGDSVRAYIGDVKKYVEEEMTNELEHMHTRR